MVMFFVLVYILVLNRKQDISHSFENIISPADGYWTGRMTTFRRENSDMEEMKILMELSV